MAQTEHEGQELGAGGFARAERDGAERPPLSPAENMTVWKAAHAWQAASRAYESAVWKWAAEGGTKPEEKEAACAELCAVERLFDELLTDLTDYRR